MRISICTLALIVTVSLSAKPTPVKQEVDFVKVHELLDNGADFHLVKEQITSINGVELGLPVYALKVTGQDTSGTFTLLARHIDDTCTAEHACWIREDGFLMTPDDTDNPLFLVLGGFAPGEPVNYYLVKADKSKCALCHVVPRPIEATTASGYWLAVERTPDTNRVLRVRAGGFDPDEIVEISSDCGVKKATKEVSVSKSGRLATLMVPGKRDDTGGRSNIELRGKKGAVTLTFPYGAELDDWAASAVEHEPDVDMVVERMSAALETLSEANSTDAT